MWCSSTCATVLPHLLAPRPRGRVRRAGSAAAPGPARPRSSAPECTGAVGHEVLEARISVARSTGALDLSDCGLDEVPPEVLKLPDLTDLSLAGNRIRCLPPAIGNLTKLRRLGLAGNSLLTLPEEIGRCRSLEGLWLHGNLLQFVPPQVGLLASLRVLALAGNQLAALPDELSALSQLQVLSVAGNVLKQLPAGIGRLAALRVLAAHGNLLRELPHGIDGLVSLQDLWLQGNWLEHIPGDLRGMQHLRQLSLADNVIRGTGHGALAGLPALSSLWLYGNFLEVLPSSLEQRQHGNAVRLWLEGNPLRAAPLEALLSGCTQAKTIGVDTNQVRGVSRSLLDSRVVVGESVGGTDTSLRRPGYFKLQPWRSPAAQKVPAGVAADVLVVAFGSAPGVPNWAGLLRKVKAEMQQCGPRWEGHSGAVHGPHSEKTKGGETPQRAQGQKPQLGNAAELPPFDILYVVDPERSWYSGIAGAEPQPMGGCAPAGNSRGRGSPVSHEQQDQGGGSSSSRGISSGDNGPDACEDVSAAYYQEGVGRACRGYGRVVMLGDSMGASAALLCCQDADTVLAFCPQVELESASIRPGRPAEWLRGYRALLLNSVATAGTSKDEDGVAGSTEGGRRRSPAIRVHSGCWSHDVDQANALQPLHRVQVSVHDVDDHRLAKELDARGTLRAIIRDTVAGN